MSVPGVKNRVSTRRMHFAFAPAPALPIMGVDAAKEQIFECAARTIVLPRAGIDGMVYP
jgi:hypothetical protein